MLIHIQLKEKPYNYTIRFIMFSKLPENTQQTPKPEAQLPPFVPPLFEHSSLWFWKINHGEHNEKVKLYEGNLRSITSSVFSTTYDTNIIGKPDYLKNRYWNLKKIRGIYIHAYIWKIWWKLETILTDFWFSWIVLSCFFRVNQSKKDGDDSKE